MKSTLELNGIRQRHGLAEVIFPVQPRRFLAKDWFGVRLHSVTPSAWFLVACSSPIRCASKATSQCSIHSRMHSVNAWAECYLFRHFAEKSSGQPQHWPHSVRQFIIFQLNLRVKMMRKFRDGRFFGQLSIQDGRFDDTGLRYLVGGKVTTIDSRCACRPQANARPLIRSTFVLFDYYFSPKLTQERPSASSLISTSTSASSCRPWSPSFILCSVDFIPWLTPMSSSSFSSFSDW